MAQRGPDAGQALLCRCGHPRDAHEHYRAGSDCGLCPCTRFRPRHPLRFALARLAAAVRPR